MKELSIEEKAKRYDEAIEKLRSLHDDYDTVSTLIDIKEELENIFPELKENEDERIRKDMIETIEKESKDFPSSVIAEKSHTWLAWLEKQGEQKPTQEIEPTPIFKIGDILKRKGKDYTFRVDRIQGGYYHCDRNHGAFFPIEEQGNWELVEQNPAWSEEDEEMFDAVIANIQFTQKTHNHEVNQIVYEREIDWLKSLKERVQPKQEWNEEDKEQLDRALYMMEQLDMTKSWDDVYNWLKFLRPQKQNITNKDFEDIIREIKTRIAQCNGFNRKHREEVFNLLDSLKPQNTWKPSNNQHGTI